ncbi:MULTISPECIES: hypothetical protein [Actinoalloteichus]|uniref:DUF2188 domain-containing protein n=1 Tax=Actinoalloteichus caeruleus DSM 43889 TaxID=1120930 RepID=A0ABT1JD87_ACTCY|nr:hypothetical protein [Actinoalloteichus caeruleus]MCP2330455.1 hypothetical protein [Actinoalloteichus caeruleus DSM 43889]
MHTRHIAPDLVSGWQITNAEGQQTARVGGSRQDALNRAHRQLSVDGGGYVTVEEDEA